MSDTINRADAIDALWKALYEYEDKTEKQFQESDELDIGDWIQHRIFVQNMSDIDRQTILELPSADASLMQDRCKYDASSELISRQDAIDAMESKNNVITEDDYHYCEDCDHIEMCSWYPTYGCEFRGRPSAERTGEWIRESLTTDCPYKCSACKKYSRARYDFCPNCGARMVSEE